MIRSARRLSMRPMLVRRFLRPPPLPALRIVGDHVDLAPAWRFEARFLRGGDDVGAVVHDAVLDTLHQVAPEHFAGGRQLVDISPASLSVFAGGRRVELDEARVRRVRQGWNDPIADGAVLGFRGGPTSGLTPG